MMTGLIFAAMMVAIVGVASEDYRPAPESASPVTGEGAEPNSPPPRGGKPSAQHPLKTLDPESKELLQKFDNYLFNNLENLYYNFSNAFQDATKRALKKCGCDVGTIKSQ